MSKQIWVSPVLGKSRERLVNRCSEMIKPGEPPRFLYLTASHPLLELVTKWILDFKRVRGVWGTLPVYLFRGFVREVLKTAEVVDTGKPLSRRVAIDTEDSYLKPILLSQIMRRLVDQGDLKALAPLAKRDGTINTIGALIGEFQRAGTSPSAFRTIMETRAGDIKVAHEGAGQMNSGAPRQIEFDREIGLIYEAYARALDQFDLTEEDADQLRALQVLSGEVSSMRVVVPWLDRLDLLVLDGFFDFTPVQGEMLRALIPRVPNVVVNLYGDDQNPEVFRAFSETLEQLRSISEEFEIVKHVDSQILGATPVALRARLFNPESVAAVDDAEPLTDDGVSTGQRHRQQIVPRIFRCKDRETEVRAIAKEIKRLVLLDGFSIRDIALVVRQRAAYAETISRTFAEESIPCTVEQVVALSEVPAVRAVLKLFQIITAEGDVVNPRVAALADLIKSGYFRLSAKTIEQLRTRTDHSLDLATECSGDSSRALDEGIGEWNPDILENVFAYVGSDLRLDKWLERARRLTVNDPTTGDVQPNIFGQDGHAVSEDSTTEDASDEESSVDELKKAFPTSEIRPAVLQWTTLVLQEFAAVIKSASRENNPPQLRVELRKLLEGLQFSNTIRDRLVDVSLESALPHAALDLRALEGIRLAISAAMAGIEFAAKAFPDADATSLLPLSTFVKEIERCINTRSLRIAGADPDGVQVLEATDVRGLRFRAVFIAGLVEGGFPLRKERDWIYPHEERERLKSYGLTLEDISPATLLKEEHYFYQAACRATDTLYLSWPLVIRGNETVVSYYLDEVRHALAPLEIENEDIATDLEGDRPFEASSRTELATSLIRLSERHRHTVRKSVSLSEGEVNKLISWAKDLGIISSSAEVRITLSRERMGERFGRYDGLIVNEHLRTLLADRFGTNYVWSASALSLFGKSPYKFFAQRVLRLEPRIEAALDLAVIDAGGLLHEALRRFYARHRDELLSLRDRNKLRDEMRRVAAEVFDEHERVVPPLNARVWAIDREIYQLQLAEVVDYELSLHDKRDANGPLPAFFELGFGMSRGIRDEKSTSEFLVLERADASGNGKEAIRLRGQIDRVDQARDGTVLAYDYKRSRGALHADMLEGRDLQISIYLDAIENLFFPDDPVAGAGFYLLRNRDRNRGLYRKEFDAYTYISTRVSSRVDERQWLADRAVMRARIWHFVDAIRDGRFFVDPTAPDQTCGMCEFAPVCRYEKYRILRKRS